MLLLQRQELAFADFGAEWDGKGREGRDVLIAVDATVCTLLCTPVAPATLLAILTPAVEAPAASVVAGIAASPILTKLALGTASGWPFPAQALAAILAALTTPAEPHCSPMHCATAVSHDGVSQRQESARQRQPEQAQVLESVHEEAAHTDWWQVSSQAG